MIVFFVVGFLVPSVWAAECSISNEDVSAEIEAVGDNVKVTLINPKIASGKWTGLAFGDKMKDLEVVIVKVEGSPTAVTGFTKQYGPPTLDQEASVKTEELTYKNGNLTFQFTRPLGKNGPREHSLEGCQMWNEKLRVPILFSTSSQLATCEWSTQSILKWKTTLLAEL
uniref:DOMON domain-containing protein n=1 Tax=Haemonchus contortus TaxID=6289 RepID=A0A7I4XWI7_HAECO